MTLMKQCRIWKEEKNYQKMISALEALSAEERTPELDSELAQAYCSSADTENRELFQKALTAGTSGSPSRIFIWTVRPLHSVILNGRWRSVRRTGMRWR